MARDGSPTNGPTGAYRSGSPGFAGQLKCQCEIWSNLPIARRRQQDQSFVFSPETIRLAPENIREKLQGVDGIDGVFLAFEPQYQHNFVCAKKRAEDEDVEVFNTDRLNEALSGVTPLARLEFYDGIRESLLGREGSRLLTVDGDDVTSATAKAAHHMWINDGSLFSDYIILPSEEDTEPEDPAEVVRRRMSARWGYDLVNAAITTKQEQEISRTSSPDYHAPRQRANALANPVTLMQQLGVESEFKDTNTQVYKGVNPGIHWRLEKRTPCFQGEDFFVEFQRHAFSSDVPRTDGATFQMRNRFKHLDVNSIPQGEVGCNITNLAMVELDQDGAVVEDSKDKFDLSKQAYYIIEIGIGSQGITSDEDIFNDVGHNYYIILAEKAAPIFCHYDRIYVRCGEDDGSLDVGSGPRRTPVLSEEPILRRLATYRGANSKRLLEQENLRVTVRQHLGRIVVTFSGYEDNPWIIERSDLTPRPDLDSAEDAQSESDFISERVPMIIPNGRVALMGGNIKASFIFAPMTYTDAVDMPMPQPLSVLGPADSEDISLLLRDKGVSQLLDVNTSDNNKQNEKKPRKLTTSNFQYNQDAEVYRETIDGIVEDTFAMQIQPDLVRKRGKAPNLQQSEENRDRPRSVIGITSRRGLQPIGSETPYAFTLQATANLQAGTYVFPAVPGDAEDGEDWWLDKCMTPIMTGFRLYSPADDNPAFRKQVIDVSHHVLSFSEDWRADDWQSGQLNTIHHQGQIAFLLNAGMQFEDEQNYASYLHSLSDKAFYIQISVWWEGGIMPLPSRDIDRVLFTGLCFGGEITYENNQRVMKCNVVDYSDILRDQKFKNSPFFDKMRDFNAVYEILQLASFRDGTDDDGGVSDQSQPASLLRRLADYNEGNNWINLVHNGETLFNREFALPGSYDILQEPFLRFQDGDTYYEAIQRIASLSGKIFFFDRLGVFHYDALPYEQELFSFQQGSGNNEELDAFDWDRLSKVDFFASPADRNDNDIHRQVFNAYTIKRNVEDINNEIRVISTTPDGKLLVAGHTNFDSLFDPDKPGFLGYPKEFMQQDGIFGDEATLKWYIKNLTKMFIPPVTLRFEAVGRNLLRALDIVTFRGLGMIEPQRLIIGSIKSEIDPQSNTWMQEFECYWLFPSTNIEWGETNNTTVALDGVVEEDGSS
tara:strand:+ start:24979 stop:28476 length:3498 start_codon:yes stop_codon:yes gene_type:complete